MSRRTRRRTVKRERREKATEREDYRLEGIAIDKIMRGARVRWEDIPDGTRVRGTFTAVTFAQGEIRPQLGVDFK